MLFLLSLPKATFEIEYLHEPYKTINWDAYYFSNPFKYCIRISIYSFIHTYIYMSTLKRYAYMYIQ